MHVMAPDAAVTFMPNARCREHPVPRELTRCVGYLARERVRQGNGEPWIAQVLEPDAPRFGELILERLDQPFGQYGYAILLSLP